MGEKKTNIFLLNLPPSCSSSSFCTISLFFFYTPSGAACCRLFERANIFIDNMIKALYAYFVE